MRASTVFAAAIACAGSAYAMTMQIASTSSYHWSVENGNVDCEGSGCSYDFNVLGAANTTSKPPRIAFSASCSGQSEVGQYQPCKKLDQEETDHQVVAMVLPRNGTGNAVDTPPQIQISLRYTDPEVKSMWWNYTGKAAAAAKDFKITPSTLTSAA
ncbi:hypothetical protein F4779DRAFT_340471 [Xylariaceae sp. FL0662B]|nr:hypothetical protein F4779DRAFT_340471 [Xylariaceae sp. FL0662B]